MHSLGMSGKPLSINVGLFFFLEKNECYIQQFLSEYNSTLVCSALKSSLNLFLLINGKLSTNVFIVTPLMKHSAAHCVLNTVIL